MLNVETGKEFEECRLESRLNDASAAVFLGVTVRTLQRWRNDGAPGWAMYMLRVHAGHLPWPGWEGWQVDNGHLFPPGYSRNGISPGDLYAVPFLNQLVAEYKKKARRLDGMFDQAAVISILPSDIDTKIG